MPTFTGEKKEAESVQCFGKHHILNEHRVRIKTRSDTTHQVLFPRPHFPALGPSFLQEKLEAKAGF